MIKFACKNCGQHIKVSDRYAGKTGKCPKCRQSILVPAAAQQPPEQSGIIKFRCSHCSQKIGLTANYAGKQVRCAKCKQPVTVPQAAAAPAVTEQTDTLRAGSEQGHGGLDALSNLGPMDELLAAEQNSPTLELTPPPPEPAADEFSGEVDPLRAGLGTYESSVGEKSGNVDAGLWIGLSGCCCSSDISVYSFRCRCG